MPSGVVKWFSKEKGYGFIVPEGDPPGADIFVHHSGILMQGYRVLETGQRVTFKAKDAPGGPMAYDVIVAQDNKPRICPTCHQVILKTSEPAKKEAPPEKESER